MLRSLVKKLVFDNFGDFFNFICDKVQKLYFLKSTPQVEQILSRNKNHLRLLKLTSFIDKYKQNGAKVC